MNDTILFHSADTTNNAISDSITYALCTKNHELYKDFKFITKTYSEAYKGPIEREVKFISAGWNFMILFTVMIMVVANKFLAPQRYATIITLPFQSGGGEKMARENQSFFNIVSLSTIVSFVLLISILIQKFYLIYGGNYILHDNINFFWNIALVVSTILIFNYLSTLLYSWLFKSEGMLFLHVSMLVSIMASATLILIPTMLLLLFYPYKFVFILILMILLMLFATRFIKLLIEVRMLTKLNFVNIFLYLCTIEILPILVMLKMVLMIV